MAPFKLRPGVLNGQAARRLYKHALQHGYAIPAVSVASFHVINAVLETASRLRKPVIIQLYFGGCVFMAGGEQKDQKTTAAVTGAVSAAIYVHRMAIFYKVPVILQTDHCNKEQLPWIDGIYRYNKKFHSENRKSLFTAHMLDFSLLSLNENIKLCSRYLEKFTRLDIQLEMEIGATGGQEDEVDNTALSSNQFYTKPQEVLLAVKALSAISNNFTIAAAFGNQHGLAMDKNILLKPELLQEIRSQLLKKGFGNVPFVFHGGSGYPETLIKQAISYGTVKVNFNAEIQMAAWNGVKQYLREHDPERLAQGEAKNSGKYYDPVFWLREAEKEIAGILESKFRICGIE